MKRIIRTTKRLGVHLASVSKANKGDHFNKPERMAALKDSKGPFDLG